MFAKDPLPNVKDAFYVVSKEESHRGLHPDSSTSSKTQPASFIAKSNNNTNNFNRRFNVNNSNNNTNRGPNPNLLCKNYGLIGHIVKRCYELTGYPAGFKRNPSLTRHSCNNNKRFNVNSEVNQSVPSTSCSLFSSFTNEQMVKLFSLINEKTSPAANMSGWIINSGANQHMTDSTKNMFNVVDVSSLMLTIGHPNGTLAKISAIGSLGLTS
nr:hypothetical protein [Tanacetum cinerariifolium]